MYRVLRFSSKLNAITDQLIMEGSDAAKTGDHGIAIRPLAAYHGEMRLAALLLRLPLAIVGEITDRLLGPDELKGLTWPDTTNEVFVRQNFDGEESLPFTAVVREKDPLGYEIIHGSGW